MNLYPHGHMQEPSRYFIFVNQIKYGCELPVTMIESLPGAPPPLGEQGRFTQTRNFSKACVLQSHMVTVGASSSSPNVSFQGRVAPLPSGRARL